jgi:hypothetical protein
MPRSTKGIPRPQSRGPRPHAWITGPDPEEHKRYRTYIQQRNQAQWRGETWNLQYAEWKQLWADSGQWFNRGRERGCYCMTRRDWEQPWDCHNAQVITREEHARMQGAAQAAGWASPARKRSKLKSVRKGTQGTLDL